MLRLKQRWGWALSMPCKRLRRGAPSEIKTRYQLSFPFTVKRVVAGCVTSNPDSAKVGAIRRRASYFCEGDYMIEDGWAQDPDSKRFVLA